MLSAGVSKRTVPADTPHLLLHHLQEQRNHWVAIAGPPHERLGHGKALGSNRDFHQLALELMQQDGCLPRKLLGARLRWRLADSLVPFAGRLQSKRSSDFVGGVFEKGGNGIGV